MRRMSRWELENKIEYTELGLSLLGRAKIPPNRTLEQVRTAVERMKIGVNYLWEFHPHNVPITEIRKRLRSWKRQLGK